MFHIYAEDAIKGEVAEVEKSYQWDVYQMLIVDSQNIPAVSFSNGLTERTFDVELELISDTGIPEFDGKSMCQIPDEMFQDSWEIKVYAWDTSKTYFEESFEVLPRPKPADYWYEPTEVAKLEDKVDKAGHYPGQILIANDYGVLQDGELNLSKYQRKDEMNDYLKTIDAENTYATQYSLGSYLKKNGYERNKMLTTDFYGSVQVEDKVDATNFLSTKDNPPTCVVTTWGDGSIHFDNKSDIIDGRPYFNFKQEYWGGQYDAKIKLFDCKFNPVAKVVYAAIEIPQFTYSSPPILTIRDKDNKLIFNQKLDTTYGTYYMNIKITCFAGYSTIEWSYGQGSNEEMYYNNDLWTNKYNTTYAKIKEFKISSSTELPVGTHIKVQAL